MNENKSVLSKTWALMFVFIVVALIAGVYIVSSPKPINVPPRAAESDDVHQLFFLAVDPQDSGSLKNITLSPGREFALAIMLSRAGSLDQDRKYKFRFKIDYNADVFDLQKPFSSQLNKSEMENSDILAMDKVFDYKFLDKVEERESKDDDKKAENVRVIEIEGAFRSDDYASLDDTGVPEERRDKLLIIELEKLKVKPNANLSDSNIQLLAWYRDETKIERVDSTFGVGFLNKNNELKLEMVNKEVKDFPTGTAVVPEDDKPPTTFGEIKVEPVPEEGGIVTGGAAIALNLKLKFQGITQKPVSSLDKMMVQVSIVNNTSLIEEKQKGEFIADSSGIWSGSLVFTQVKTGSDYRLLIKGARQLQKKICVREPTGDEFYKCGSGKISLEQGKSYTFDFTKIVMLSGDVNQDGRINSADLVAIREAIREGGGQNLDKFKNVDLNGDGYINTIDLGNAIHAMEASAVDEQ